MIMFETLQQLVKGIKALKLLNIEIDYYLTYNYHSIDPKSKIFDSMLYGEVNLNDVEYILNDMHRDMQNFNEMIEYILYTYLGTANTNVLNIMLDRYFKNKGQKECFIGYTGTIPLFLKTRNEILLKIIIKNLNFFELSDEVIDILIPHIVQQQIKCARLILKKESIFYMKKYDKAVKQRIVDISAGFGYQGLPNLVINAIIEEAVDTSGLTAYKVDKIIDKFNIWKTDTTMRLGKQQDYQQDYQQEFQDAQKN